jgi:hypothetical protein
MFKPEAYVDSVLDLLDDEQTLVAENIIKNPLDMQERYMSPCARWTFRFYR